MSERKHEYPPDFEVYWETVLAEKVETPSYALKARRNLYTGQCLDDWKEVVFRLWNVWQDQKAM